MTVITPAPVLRRVAIPASQDLRREHAWLRDVLALDVRQTLGRAAWRPQVLCLAVHAYLDDALHDPSGWPTLDELAEDLGWAVGLVRRHLEIAHVARLLEILDDTELSSTTRSFGDKLLSSPTSSNGDVEGEDTTEALA